MDRKKEEEPDVAAEDLLSDILPRERGYLGVFTPADDVVTDDTKADAPKADDESDPSGEQKKSSASMP